MSVLRRRCVLAGALSLIPLAAFAASSGSCKYKDQKLTLVDGVIYQKADPFEAGKKETTLALASVKLDAGKIAGAEDPEDALRDQVWAAQDGGQVRLTLGEGGVTGIYAYIPPGANISQSGSAFGDLKLAHNDAKGAAGSFRLEGKAADDLSCDLHFDLAYAKPAVKPTGKPIAAGGGELGNVLQTNVAAMQKGDVDAMLATVSKAQGDQMRAHRKDANFPAMLEMMKAFAPKSVKVLGGQDFGDHAELTLEGVDQSGAKSSGTAQMVKEDGKWKVEKTSMNSKSGG